MTNEALPAVGAAGPDFDAAVRRLQVCLGCEHRRRHRVRVEPFPRVAVKCAMCSTCAMLNLLRDPCPLRRFESAKGVATHV